MNLEYVNFITLVIVGEEKDVHTDMYINQWNSEPP